MTADDLWEGRNPPDVSGAVMTVAMGGAALAFPLHDPGSPAGGLLLVAIAVGLSVAAWSTVMGLGRRMPALLRAGLATIASVAAMAWLFADRSVPGAALALVVLAATARLERPPGHRAWRHAALAAATLLGGLVLLTG